MVKTNFYSGLNSVVVQALNDLQYRYSNETPEMWCSRIRYSFRTLLENNPKYFFKNGFIQMIERSRDGRFMVEKRSFYIYCTVCDTLKNVKNEGVPSRKSISLLSLDEIEKIYQTYWIMYSKGLAHYSYDYLYEVWNMVRNDGTPDKKKFLGITSHDIKIPDDRYVDYFGQKIQAKDVPAHYQKFPILFDHYTPYRWLEKKKEQLWKRLDLVSYIFALAIEF
ncbi:25642_t:CDS:2 [Gigaspora margarita]|uniref:25642_t:CDS:1 n=1 Tax=Gigaspora margarita TaxID=4874 RepID=A0ABN7WP74_GIGMA|nr:25642_t:CDS:2 [Gigaspora margarita]